MLGMRGNVAVPPGHGFTYEGTWSAIVTYDANDVVTYNGSTYISLINNNLNKQPDTNPASWALYTSKGDSGPSGVSGGSGASGGSGPSGISGEPGGTGGTGASGAKAAILKLRGKWRALICVEAPEPRFEELMVVEAHSPETTFLVDPIFVEACEPKSLRIRSTASEDTGLGHSKFKIHQDGEGAFIEFLADADVAATIKAGGKIGLNITVTGLRRDQTGRFAEYTEDQAKSNNDFWSQATKPKE